MSCDGYGTDAIVYMKVRLKKLYIYINCNKLKMNIEKQFSQSIVKMFFYHPYRRCRTKPTSCCLHSTKCPPNFTKTLYKLVTGRAVMHHRTKSTTILRVQTELLSHWSQSFFKTNIMKKTQKFSCLVMFVYRLFFIIVLVHGLVIKRKFSNVVPLLSGVFFFYFVSSSSIL